MNEGMSEARLAEIRASYPLNDDRPWDAEDAADAFQAVQELLTEVDRLRGVKQQLRATVADEVAAIGQGLERDEELKQLRSRLAEIGETREEWGVRGGGGTFRMGDEAEARWHAQGPAEPMIVVRRLLGKWHEVPDA